MKIYKAHLLTGILSAMLACTGGAVLIINSALKAGFTNPELISWMFSVYFLGGLLNVGLSFIYKIPFGGAHSITAAAFLSTSIVYFSIEELAGAAIMSGAVIAFFGISGLGQKLLAFLPVALMDAMLAGLIFNHIVQIIPAIKETPFIGMFALAGFFLFPKLINKCPPILGVIGLGMMALFIGYDLPKMEDIPFSLPYIVTPIFSWNSFVSLSVPLALLVISNDIFVALAVLRKNGYEPSAARTITITGAAASLVGWFGGHSVNIGGMMTMLCSSDEAGPKEKKYFSAIVSGLLVALFGLMAWKVIAFIKTLPISFIWMITGFSLMAVFMKSIQSAFSKPEYRYSTVFTFAIAVSNISFMGISAPVWSLAVGLFTMKWLGEGRNADKG
ncbi:benzoate/H(+) symporter BenE family transporter [Candidatus Pristimantibacillus sp. PTI5]|uniref:benzoate/H(+) symporter BenE family transporter n=1 Tax=Candidatus Pristimantibacillus sp. PTI5 TaxID=3400422 RepID=UPI003B01019E